MEKDLETTLSSYTDQEGILKGSGLKRFGVRNKIDGKSKNEKFNYGTNISINYNKNDIVTSVGSGGVNQNFIIGAYRGLPYLNPNDYVLGEGSEIVPAFANAPFLLLDKLDTFTNLQEEVKILGGLNAGLKLGKNLKANTRFTVDYSSLTSLRVSSPISFNETFFAETDPVTGDNPNQDSKHKVLFVQLVLTQLTL